MDAPLRIGNCSGFYGDRFAAAREQLEGGPLDVLTGDYLAELTLLILARARRRPDGVGYARTFLRQMREILVPCRERGVRVVVNAGGLDPAGLAAALRELAAELDVDLPIGHVEGDDLRPRLDALRDAGETLAHLDTGRPLADLGVPPLTANAYLGAWGIAAALDAGAQIVVTGRVSDASLVVGPAASHFGWARDDWDRLAGAVVAGHVLECGAQATGGNHPFFLEVPGLEHVGFPLAELHADGSSVITKHPGTGGSVDTDTVTAQLLYEIAGPAYPNPDVTVRFDTIRLVPDGRDRVRIDHVRGGPPPDTTKVAVTALGGYRNRVTFLLAGLDLDAKAALVRRQLTPALDAIGPDLVEWRLTGAERPAPTRDPADLARLTLTVHHGEAAPIGRALAAACVELGLASYPGFTLTAPPGDAEAFGRYWPTSVAAAQVPEVAVLPDGERVEVRQTGADHGRPLADCLHASPPDRTDADGTPAVDVRRRVPLGRFAGARSGDKGGHANVGLWVRDPAHLPWLRAVAGDPEAVRRLLPEAANHRVEVHALPNLAAINVVVHGLLGDGVASSTRPDPQAKGLGEHLRAQLVPAPAGTATDASRGSRQDVAR
ncbi:acyclic terpene utilization AtuA family protein [Egicoccus halophilus]|uniref:Exopolyphosphatase n=1 Tax=Egicoccus halophilus TaxID=1670830 RepID=A0A8J3AH85_9ACTN|nr:acyclic terpene utilization AtuA family protein [Egicoccus halophilus]GGI09731.1 exopolyphosphatase [Egicoccus halophilus]